MWQKSLVKTDDEENKVALLKKQMQNNYFVAVGGWGFVQNTNHFRYDLFALWYFLLEKVLSLHPPESSTRPEAIRIEQHIIPFVLSVADTHTQATQVQWHHY